MAKNKVLHTLKGTPVRRCEEYGVGKRMMEYIYVHHSALGAFKRVLPECITHYVEHAVDTPDVLRLTSPKGVDSVYGVEFIWCRDFNEEDEPTLVKIAHMTHPLPPDTWGVPEDIELEFKSLESKNPLIYHHKWQFVFDTYEGFDVEESFRRSKAWLSVPDLDMRKIGRYSYWNDEVIPKIPEY